jgi:hypothetical protein
MIPLFMSSIEFVVAIGPSSQSTVNAPVVGGHGPAVFRLTTSFSVPGSLPWHALRHEPIVAPLTPLILVRIGESWMPSETVAVRG